MFTTASGTNTAGESFGYGRGTRWINDLGRDARHALRGLGRSPGFAATVVVLLALGIGANTAMFGIVYGVLLRPLPYPDADAVVRIGESLGSSGGSDMWLSNRSMPLLDESGESFEHLAGYQEISARSASLDGAILAGARVSPSLFPLLRSRPQMGRLFTEEEAREGAHRVVLFSHSVWARRFGSDTDVVGTLVDLDGEPHTVVGVLPDGFDFPNPASEFWTPLVIPPLAPTSMDDPAELPTVVNFVFGGLGRLRSGVSPEQAATEARTILQTSGASLTARAGENQPPGGSPEVDVRVVPLLEERVGQYRPALLVLTAATALVLLIAGTNVAGLLSARGVTRQRMFAVCAALGAGKGRLVRQLLTEGVTLSLAGGMLGLAAATVVLGVAPALVPGDVARLDEVGIDRVTVAFTIGLSVFVGLLSGAVPALQWSRLDLTRTLNGGSTQSAGGFRLLRSNRSRAVLVMVQVALALVLLIGSGLLLRSFVGLVTFDRGYDPANVVSAAALFPFSSQPSTSPEAMANSAERYGRLHERLLDEMTARLEPLPDVEAFGLSRSLPFERNITSETLLRLAGTPMPSDRNEMVRTKVRIVSPGYFEAMRFRLRDGRAPNGLDGPQSPRVLVANETLARELFGGGPAVGQRVMDPMSEAWEVVGVVGDIVYEGLELTAEPQAEAFYPMVQVAGERGFGWSSSIFVTVRTTDDSLAVVPFLREALAAADPQARLDSVTKMKARLSTAVAEPRFYAVFIGSFAGLALLLAALGIFGLLSYTVAQRQGEIGIRMALGARRGDILALVTRQAVVLIAIGTTTGLAGATASSRVLESLLYGVATDDLLTFAVATLVLVAVALIASWLPARQATRIDPLITLRSE